ncbi:MAG: SDR family oxidoreductase [Smithella sp.]
MATYKRCVGVIGATSIVGEFLLPLLVQEGYDVVAFSRQEQCFQSTSKNNSIIWKRLTKSSLSDINNISPAENKISYWINLAPIWVLPEYFPMLLAYGARHIVTVSSTSKFTKSTSDDPAEKKLAERLKTAEASLTGWAEKEKISFTILSATMIYGLGRDGNISVIASFIRRFSFFCVFGDARGLRQPLHANDVAFACVQALKTRAAHNRFYHISGGEVLTYREMVCRIFSALGKTRRFIQFPLWLFRAAMAILRVFPPFRHWSFAMAERMNQDMVFDHSEANRDLNFRPRKFQLDKNDLPKN